MQSFEFIFSKSKNNDDILLKFNQSFLSNQRQKDGLYRQNIRSNSYKSLGYFRIIEICFLVLILFEHTFIFILTFKKRSSERHHK